MDAETRHRHLQLLGVELRARPKRDGDGDGFIDPDGKGPAPDKTPYVPVPKKPPAVKAKQPRGSAATLREHVAHWHADLADMDALVRRVASGSTPARLLHSSEGVKVALADFGDGAQGAITVWTGTDGRIGDDMADSDQLVSALARAIGIDAPRVLRVDEDKTVSDLVDGEPWNGDPDERLGLLDLLAGIDGRDPSSVVVGPDGPVPVRSGAGFAVLDGLPAEAPESDLSTDERRLRKVAAAIDAAGPRGLLRADITARAGIRDAHVRDKLLDELLATGRYVLVPSPTGNTGAGARIVSVNGGLAGMSASGLAAATAPDDPAGFMAIWALFAANGEWIDNPLTASDVAWLRRVLERLRPQFEHLGRLRWWRFAMDRLDVLAAHARGNVNLFAPQ